MRDEAGNLIARSVHHQSFLAEQTSGEVTLRDPASKEGARQAGEPSGEPLSVELRKTFTPAMCDEFFYRSRNYHNDKDASKELGFGDTVIGGRMTLSCVTELLTRHFGRGFYLGGRLDVKFTNVLWPNEPFTTRGSSRAVAWRAARRAPTSRSSARRLTERRSSWPTRVPSKVFEAGEPRDLERRLGLR